MRRVLILVVASAATGALAGCTTSKGAASAASAAKACGSINLSALDLSQKITIDAFSSGKASTTELTAIDTDMSALRNAEAKITATEQVSLSRLLDDAGIQRAALAAGTKVDAATVSEDQAALARVCIAS